MSARRQRPEDFPPGWTGGVVVVKHVQGDGSVAQLARVSVQAGVVVVDSDQLRALFEREGVVGRAHLGRLWPKDGAAFVDELPFALRGLTWAEPA